MFSQESLKPIRSYSEDSTLIPRTDTGDGTRSEQMEQSFPHKLPTPPSSRPSSSRRPRCRSLRGNLRPNTKQRTPTQPELTGDKNDSESSDFDLRKYKLLPAIGSQDSTNNNNESEVVSNVSKMVNVSEKVSEIAASNEEVLDLAIKLLDGSRLEHCFSSVSTFRDIVQYLRSVASLDGVPTNCEFVTCGVPRQIFSNLSVSLGEANIKTRTLLYLRESDPD